MIFVDSARYYSGQKDSSSNFYKFLTRPGFRFMCLYRLINKLSRKNPLSFPLKIWYKNLQVKYGYQIPHACKIGSGLFLGHYGNIVINQHVIIGSNCNIAQGVTLGNASRGERKGYPIVGDRVWIGANAVVVGKIKIGNDVLIAPLSYVNFDIPDNAVVVGNPASIVNYKGSSEYIKNLV